MATKTVATKGEIANYLVTGYWAYNGGVAHKWASSSVTYSFNAGWSAAEKLSVASAFRSWSDVANISFTEAASGGSITFTKGTDGGAWSSSPYNWAGNILSSQISIDTRIYGWDDLVTIGKYGVMTLIHEIGHTLGLGHSGPYNGNGSYANDAIFDKDTRQYTLMSYWGEGNSGAYYAGKYASTPLLYDIYAIQKIYGANTSTRAGDTVYGFHSTAGSDQFDFTKTAQPVVAIWDGGGSDTLDLSGYSMASRIDLTPGSFSDAGGLTGNIAIAYGSTIENAIGGSGNDTILGNDANNTLTGGRGNDSIDGGAGINTAVFSGNRSNYDVSAANGVTTVTDRTAGRDGTDTLRNIQYLQFADQRVTVGAVNRAPVITGSPQTVGTGHAVVAASLFGISDPDGDTISQYQFYDPAGGGAIRLNGATNLLDASYQAQGYYRVSAAELSKLQYVGGGGAGSETLTLWAFDGYTWGAGSLGVTTATASSAAQNAGLDAGIAEALNAYGPSGSQVFAWSPVGSSAGSLQQRTGTLAAALS